MSQTVTPYTSSPSLTPSRASRSLHISLSPYLPSSSAFSRSASASSSDNYWSYAASTPSSSNAADGHEHEEQQQQSSIHDITEDLKKTHLHDEVMAPCDHEIPSATNAFSNKYPHASLTPEEVLTIQLGALKQNDAPFADAGIEIAFRFASPANRMFTGPVERYGRMLHTALYESMLNHEWSNYTPANSVGNKWQICVCKGGVVRKFLWSLSKQTAASYEGCWMIDSIVLLQD